ncbi:MAG: hypothetical protein AAGD10_06960 [Myxococcota bacterium]
MIAVVVPVPEEAQELRGRARVLDLRRRARAVTAWAAALVGAPSPVFRLDEQGRPLPHRGWYWSYSHNKRGVAGVVNTRRVGVDIEADRAPTFIGDTKAWVQAEASLKHLGHGIRRLTHVRFPFGPIGGRVQVGSDLVPVSLIRAEPMWAACTGLDVHWVVEGFRRAL